MENKKILNIETKIKNIENELFVIKEKVGFSDLLSEYKQLKKKLFNVENKISKSKDEEKTKEFEIDHSNFENRKKEIKTELDKVTKVEERLYNEKNKLLYIIETLDKNYNYFFYKENIALKEIENLENSISDKYNKNLSKQIIDLEKEIEFYKGEENKLKNEKKPFKFITYKIKTLNNKYLSLKKEEKNNQSLNKENIENEIRKKEIIVSTNKEKASKLKKEIDYTLKIFDDIDKSLMFIDEDEIDTNSSFVVKNLDVFYGPKQALFNVNIKFPKNEVIAIIGPSGCGKSTFLKTLNRINDNIPSFKAKGQILFDGEYDIFKLISIRNRYDKMELSTLRTKVGMIFQQPNPFPMTIAKNVQYGPKIKGIKNKLILNELTENSLKEAGLWEEVKDNLKALGTSLSGGQQQRLCIARAIANEPEILLMDEPTSALDPIAAKKVEDLILKLKEHYTVIMVTHSMQQAQRISDKTAFFYQGELIEYGDTKQIFERPKQKETNDYVSGKFG